MIKKIKILFILFCAIVFISGCASDNPSSVNDSRIKIVVSILPLADFAEKIGGNKVDVTVMIPPGASPATYEPTPTQLKHVNDADIYIMVGSGIPFEKVWMKKIEDMNGDMIVIDCSNDIDIIGNDPHIWLSPKNAKLMIENIYHGLIEIDSANEAYYSSNMNEYMADLESLDNEINDALSGISNRKFIVFHPAWTYFAQHYNLVQIPVEIEGKEPSSADISQLIDFAKQNDIKVIFVQPQFSRKSAEVIARETESNIVTIDALARDYIGNLGIVSKTFADNMR